MSLKDDESGNARLRDYGAFVFLLRFAKPHQKVFTKAFLWMGIGSLLGISGSLALGGFLNAVVEKTHVERWALWAIAIIGSEVGAVLLLWYSKKLFANGSLETLYSIRENLIHKLEKLPMRYFDQTPLGRTVTRMTYDVEGIEEFFTSTLSRVVSVGLNTILITITMFVSSPLLATWAWVSIIPAFVLTWVFRKPLRDWNREFSKRNSAINAQLSEFLNGLNVIRLQGAEKWAKEKFDKVVKHHFDAAMVINALNAVSRPLIMFCCFMPLLAIFFVGGKQVLAGSLSLGLFIAFLRLSDRFSRPISQLTQEVHVIQAAFANAERVAGFLRENEELPGGETLKQTPSLRGKIQFENVTMSYDGKNTVLNNVSFLIPSGEIIGLAGRTGSGKTSTVSLLSRLYPYQSGRILVDDHPLESYSLQDLRSQIGFVSQDVIVFKGTLRENLCLGRQFSDLEILHASRISGFENIMKRNQWSLDYACTEQGENLSVGEKQLVALTRVLLQNPKILILDEATANVDPETESWIQKGLEHAMSGRTCLIIAHRLATLEFCDRIFVFQKGELLEEGNFTELVKQRGAFYDLIENSKEFSNREVT